MVQGKIQGTVRRDLKAAFILHDPPIIQKELAEEIGITEDHLSDVINGRARMTDRLARDISRITGIPLEMVKGQGNGRGG